MKKILPLMMTGIIFLALTVPAYAHYEGYKDNIKEGISAIVKSPLPLADAMKEEYKEAEFKPIGVIGGFLKGGYYAVKEIGRGIFRILTFNIESE